jgi:PAT family beta-lactamase induction signal transducer AmpG
MLALVGLACARPEADPLLTAVAACFVTFFSASQDIVIDAYRREDLSDAELGLGSSLYVNGYRIGMLVAGSGGLILADHLSFRAVYLIMAGIMLVGGATTLAAREPSHEKGAPTTFGEAVIGPFVDYFRRPGAWLLLLFILFYKIGDQMATTMTMPFYLELGFTKTEIGTVVKFFGFWATIGGGLLGGILMLRLGIYRSLWIFGILQGISTTGFALLAHFGPSLAGLAGAVAAENFTGGMGTAAYVAFMAALTNKRFTATQYALLSSLMGIPRVLAAAPTGYAVAALGWVHFFLFCALAAIPGLLLLSKVGPQAE